MLHPHAELRWVDDSIGLGVFATRRLPRGTILWALDPLDQRLRPELVAQMDPVMAPVVEKYTFRNRHGESVLCWDHGRFMNHSCSPVSLSPGVDFELAVRDVEVGDELTCDYGALNLERPFECLCGEPDCRGSIRPDDFDRVVPRWDELLRGAIVDVLEVAQPLLPVVARPERLSEWARHPERLPSSRLHRLAAAADARSELNA